MNLNHSKLNARLLLLIVWCFITLECVALEDSELADFARTALEDRAKVGNAEEAKRRFRKALETLDDAQKIRAFALYFFETDEDPRWKMSTKITMTAGYALGQDSSVINDWSELRKLIREESDPRKFYLLSCLIPWSTESEKFDFVAERLHMLFQNGPVARDEGEYTKSYSHDVSLYAYESIITNLRILGADFETPTANLNHEDRVLVLAKWLKENWPGCENLKIPPQLSGEGIRPDRKLATSTTPPLTSEGAEKSASSAARNSEQSARKYHWAWIITGALAFLVFLSTLIKSKRNFSFAKFFKRTP
jgi:hypothetical protein